MTYSTTTDNRQTLHDIIMDAASLAGRKARGTDLPGEEYEQAKRFLWDMLTEWEMKGLQLHKTHLATLFLDKDVATYRLGSTARCALDPVSTTTSAATSSGGNTLTLTSVTNIAVNDNIGVIIAGNLFWTTVASIASNVVTLADNVTGDVLSGAKVYAYTSTITRPILLEKAWRMQNHDDSRVEVVITPENDFMGLQPSVKGDPLQVYYDPRRDTYGNLYIYPIPIDSNDQVLLKVQLPAYLPQSNSEYVDIPQQWQSAVKYNLAVRIGQARGFGERAVKNGVIQTAQQLYLDLDAHDRESATYIDMFPDFN